MITDNQVRLNIHKEGVTISKSEEEILSLLLAFRAHASGSETQGALDSLGHLRQKDCWVLLQI